MGAQFIHLEGYARRPGKGKAGGHCIASVLAEAGRAEGATPHVERPAPPLTLFGDLAKVEAAANEWAEQAKDEIGRKLRVDGLCMLAGVVSVPDDMEANKWAEYKAAVLDWLRQRYGARLKAVVEHTDEAHRHCHFFAVPLAGERFDDLHAGRKVFAQMKAAKASREAQEHAYKNEMRGFQREFHVGVSAAFGLAKKGPTPGRRLSRAEWNDRRADQRALEEEIRRLKADGAKWRAAANKAFDSAQRAAEKLKRLTDQQASPKAA